MTDEVKPVVFKITLDTADAQRQLDALNRGGGKGTPDGKGVPQAPKPGPNEGGRVPGETPGPRAIPGRGAGTLPLNRLPGAALGFQSAIGGINRAILDPVGAVDGAAVGIAGAAIGAAQVAGVIVGSAVFLERIIPLILESLADSFPDMPFFREYAKEFDRMVSDKITEMRAWIAAVIPTIQETSEIDRAILQSGGTLNAANTLGLGGDLFQINKQLKRIGMDDEKELDKIVFKGLMKSLAAGAS